MLKISEQVIIPSSEIDIKAVRSTGAGGQNVNKVATAIHLRFDIKASSLPNRYKEKLLNKSDSRISTGGIITIKAQQFRTQHQNKEDALERLKNLIKSVLIPQKKSKAELVAKYIRHQETLAEARKNEAKRISTLAKQAENSATRLRHYLTNQMLRSNVNRIDGVSVKIGLRKKQPTVLINVPPEELPAEYVKVTYKPDLTKIRNLLKVDAVGAIGWAYLSESHEYSVTIR